MRKLHNCTRFGQGKRVYPENKIWKTLVNLHILFHSVQGIQTKRKQKFVDEERAD